MKTNYVLMIFFLFIIFSNTYVVSSFKFTEFNNEDITPPKIPIIPSGEWNCTKGEEYTYWTAIITDDQDNRYNRDQNLYFCWDFDGDDIVDKKQQNCNSCRGTTIKNNWEKIGIYEIRVKAYNCTVFNNEEYVYSNWSEPLKVIVKPKIRFFEIIFYNIYVNNPDLILFFQELI